MLWVLLHKVLSQGWQQVWLKYVLTWLHHPYAALLAFCACSGSANHHFVALFQPFKHFCLHAVIQADFDLALFDFLLAFLACGNAHSVESGLAILRGSCAAFSVALARLAAFACGSSTWGIGGVGGA